jgi:hypothetical protein
MSKAERERQREADHKEFLRQTRESHTFAPIMTRGKSNPFDRYTPEHDRWERMAAIQHRLDERRAKRAATKQQHSEEE